MTVVVVEWLVEGCVVAAIATLAVRLIPSRHAARRHTLLWLALICIVALPAAALLDINGVTPHAAVPTAPYASAAAMTIPALPGWVDAVLLSIWGVAAMVSLVRLATGVAAIRELVRSAAPIDASVEARMGHLAPWRGARNPRIVVSAAIDGACAVGFLRPRIVVSGALVRRLEVEDLEAVVLHECAHLERFDDWTRLAQRVLLMLAGLHPAVRWISRQIEIECEAACDRLVVDRIAAPVRYARALAQVGAISTGRRTPRLVPAALMPRAGLHGRVARLLGQTTAVSRRWANAASLAAAGVIAGGVGVAAAMPPLIVSAPLERSMAQLVSRPLPVGWKVAQSPAALRSADEPVNAVPPPAVAPVVRPAHAADAGPDAGAERDRATSPVLDGDVPDSIRRDEARPVSAPDVAPLPSVALLPIEMPRAARPTPESLVADSTPGWNAFGSGAGQAGAAAGDAASRAGTAIGRAFKKGGLAIARSF